MAISFPIEAYLQIARQKEINRQMAMQNAVGISENVAGSVAALQKQRAQQQLMNAIQQPGQVPIQGPQQMGPLNQEQQAVAPGTMVQNPQADVMGPLMKLYPDMMVKSLEAQMNPLTQSEIFKNYATGMAKDKPETVFTPEQAAFNVGDPGLANEFQSLYGGKVPPQAVTARGQATNRAGIDRRFEGTMGDRETNRQLRIDKGIADIGIRIDSHPVIKKLREQEVALGQVDELLGLVKSGNSVAAAGMGIKMAKAMGEVGVMTDQDIKRYVTSGKLTQGAADKLSKWLKGTPSQATQAELQQITDVMKNSFDKKIQPFLDRQVNLISRNYGISPEDAAFRLDVPYSGMTGKKVASELNKSTEGWNDAKEARYQELLRKKGKK